MSGDAGDDSGYGGTGDDWWSGAQNGSHDVDRFYGGSGNDGSHGGDHGHLRMYGESGGDRLSGGNDKDLLVGGPGADTIEGFRGNDSIRGGSGKDTVSFAGQFSERSGVWSGNLSKMRVDLKSGQARGLGRDRLTSIEAVIPGGNRDILLGSRRAETFYLSAESIGPDTINGRGGHDTVAPEPDLTYGPAQMWVDLTEGTARFDYAWGSVEKNSINRITSIENVIGTDINDVLRGDAQRNTMWGMDGDDVISGLGGRDKIDGGNDNDKLSGGSGRDRLRGGSGSDQLNGGSGRDRNDGGAGADQCRSPTGGAGTRSCESTATG